MTYYRKYRPQKISELDIAEVRESLEGLVKTGAIPHALLFSGPKGTGKTSAARIIAKIVNCERKGKEPCDKCKQCISIIRGSNIDVIELDAASHRGIEDVRSLRDAVKLTPASAKKKVYIIDEVHMLTLDASNALLKTLEEPPNHIIFILATTNPEKLVDTIRSRTTDIIFRRATDEEILRSLARVVKGEKIKIKEDSLAVIAKAARGSFRDATKTLEQLVSEKKPLGKENVEEYLFKKKALGIDGLLQMLVKKDVKEALEEVSRIAQRGVEMDILAQELIAIFRANLLAKVGIGQDTLNKLSKADLLNLIRLFSEALREIKDSPIETLPVEIAIVEWCEGIKGAPLFARLEPNSSPDKIGTDSPDIRFDSVSESLTQTVVSGAREQSMPQEKENLDKEASVPSGNIKLKEITDEVWRRILATVKPINTSIEALLRAAKPVSFDGEVLTLGVYYRFHKERLEDGHHRKILEEVVATVLGTPVKVICILSEPPIKPQPVVSEEKTVLTEGEDKDIIKIAEEIFGK